MGRIARPGWLTACLVLACGQVSGAVADRAQDIVQRSVANTNADWAAAPQYEFTEHDIITQHGARTEKTYQVHMIEGSTYNQLIAVNGQPLSGSRADAEKRKLQQEIQRRHSQSPSARQKRIAQYQRERRQDHALMAEMVKAFDFQLAGEETIDGRRCYKLVATPRAAYRPPNRETQVLKGMRGTMWVDTQRYQWVKVHAEVFRPVSFGLFIARVQPGTEFTLEDKPVQANLWLPSHFDVRVNARVVVWNRRSDDNETYTGYHRAANVPKSAGGPP